jgi:hypothetical protein
MTDIGELEKELQTFLWILINGDTVDQHMAKKQVDFINKRVADLEKGVDLATYIIKTQDILAEYNSIKITYSFMRTTQSAENTQKEQRKQKLVDRYLLFARDYVKLNIKKQEPVWTNNNFCIYCKNNEFDMIEEQNVCSNCGMVNEILDNTPTFKDTVRVNMCEPYRYSRRGHIQSAICRFQGKQNKTIPPKIYDILTRSIYDHNLTPETTTKDNLYLFLSEHKSDGLNDYYEDINKIEHVITGKPLPDISKYETTILELSDQYDEIYDHQCERKHAHNVNHKLYKILNMLGYPCKKTDFYFLKTKEKEDEHDEIWEQCVGLLMEKYPNSKWKLI